MLTGMNRPAVDEIARGCALRYFGTPEPALRFMDIERFARQELHLPLTEELFAGKDRDKLGYLSDGATPVTVLREGEERELVWPRDTIVIHAGMALHRLYAQRRFTIAHEVGHFVLERVGVTDPEPSFNQTYDHAAGLYSARELHRLFSVKELQANRFASRILMPDFCMQAAFGEFFRGEPVPVFGEYQMRPGDKRRLQYMADDMGVSFSAMYYRLKSMDLLEHHPLEELLQEEIFCV